MRSGLTCPGRRDTLRLLALPRAPRFTRFSLPASGLATTLVLLGAGASAADGSAADGSVADGSAIPSSPLRELSDYETESLNFALAEIDGRLDPGPEGKRIEAIEVVTLEVIERRDPAPRFLNWFHVTTQKSIIRREVLLAVGSPYRQDLASETERNLREFAQFSVVLVQPVEGSTPDTVRVLVVTKDVWSLRVSWEPTFYNGRLTSIRLSPAESNLLGTTQIVSGHVSLDANNYWLGATYYTPRIGGSRINASFSANAAFDCSTGNVEGGSGVLDYGQPLYSTRTKWSWRVRSTYYNAIVRPRAGREDAICSSTGPDVIRVVPQAEAADTLDTQRDVLLVPYIYRAEQLRSQLVFTRSLFVRNKIDLSFGAEADRQAYTLLDEYFERTRAGVDRWDDAQQCWLSPGAGDDCSHRFQAEEYPVTDRPEDRAAGPEPVARDERLPGRSRRRQNLAASRDLGERHSRQSLRSAPRL